MLSNTRVILDTNIILFNALSLTSFHNTSIYIPITVIEEVDKFKRDPGENGRHARHFSRFIDELRAKGNLSEGVGLELEKSTVYVTSNPLLPEDILHKYDLDYKKNDNLILATALSLKIKHPKDKVKLITKDINLRIKADLCQVIAENYEPDHGSDDQAYEGYCSIPTTSEDINLFYKQRYLEPKGDLALHPNEYIVLEDSNQPNHKALGRYDAIKKQIVSLHMSTESIWGIQPRNMEQSFALDSLLNDDIALVSLAGKAGTGKTLLAIATGLYKTLDENHFKKLLVSRPVFPMGKDIGYLPGSVEEKLNPWMQPIFDNIDFLMGSENKSSNRAQELINQGMISIEPLTYIRGRSIPQQFLIVDEAQNLTPHEIKTIITRAGQGTKIVLTGDVYQIDNPYLDAANSGLAYISEKFKDHAIASHVNLQKGERSELAELASNIL
ncbi:MAG: PhoH family protein [Bdellovibrionaceae bacterium]|nr:PhoH family protein [Pseudobdellovibrionaceae bacterium]